MHFSIPGEKPLDIQTVIFDLNGTLTIDGVLLQKEALIKRMEALRQRCLRLFLFTGDTHGNAQTIAKELGLEVRVTPDAQAKADEAKKLDPSTCAAIGNGRIDLELFRTVRLRILTLQAEGAHPETILASDVVVSSIIDALDLLLNEKRLIATLRR